MASWGECVSKMAGFYQSNIHTYQGQKGKGNGQLRQVAWIPCSLIGGTVRDDCSGFVSACLQLAGIFPKTFIAGSCDFSNVNSACAKRLKAAGFTHIPYQANLLRPGDIYSGHNSGIKHVEICAGGGKTYSWGNIHDIEHGGMPSYMFKGPYTIIWRIGNGKEFEMVEGGDVFGTGVALQYNTPRNEQKDHELFVELATCKVNLIKEILEDAGILFDDRKHNISELLKYDDVKKSGKVYKWYNKKSTDSLTSSAVNKKKHEIKYINSMGGDDDNIEYSLSEGIAMNVTQMGIFPPGTFGGLFDFTSDGSNIITDEQANENAMKIMQFFVSNGLTPEQASGFVGCWGAESMCNPHAYNKEEKQGTFNGSSANGAGYGAGLAQWSHTWKQDLQKLIGRNDPIENWDLNTQLKACWLDLQKGNKSRFLPILKRCTGVVQATDAVLRGYENGGNGTFASIEQINKYTWCGGYKGAMQTRCSYAKKWYEMYKSKNK